MDGQVPTAAQVRTRIDACGDAEFGAALRTTLLLCARVSEVVAKDTPGDPKTHARGPNGNDAKAEMWASEDGKKKEKALVVDVHTAKRGGLLRKVGLPADVDPWVRKVADYFWRKGDEPVFPFSRQTLGNYARDNHVFEGMVWPVEKYTIMDAAEGLQRTVERMVLMPDGSTQKVSVLEDGAWKKVEGHMKTFTIHSLRDVRASQLLAYYGFDGTDLAIHGGWSIQRSVAGVSAVMARYLRFYEQWQKPFPKLLKPLPV